MKNKKNKKNKKLRQKDNIFLQKLVSAVHNDAYEYVNDDSVNITIATLELIWSKYNIAEFIGSYHLNEKDYDKYFKKNIGISSIQGALLRYEFKNDNIDEIYDEDEKNFNQTFEFIFERLKSTSDGENDKKTNLLIGLLHIVQERINTLDSSILRDDITKEEFFKHIDTIFFP